MNGGEIVLAIAGAIGAKELIEFLVKRYTTNKDNSSAQRQNNRDEVTAIAASTNAAMLERLLTQMDQRIQGYELSITTMSARHESDMEEQKSLTHRLERKVEDLQNALRDWQLGNRVPRGQVLVPVNDIKRVRELSPGILNSAWYPGEDEIDAGGVHA